MFDTSLQLSLTPPHCTLCVCVRERETHLAQRGQTGAAWRGAGGLLGAGEFGGDGRLWPRTLGYRKGLSGGQRWGLPAVDGGRRNLRVISRDISLELQLHEEERGREERREEEVEYGK